MSELNAQVQDHEKRLSKVETKVDNIKEKIIRVDEKMEVSENSLIRISTILELYKEDYKKRDRIIDQISTSMTQLGVAMGKTIEKIEWMNNESKDMKSDIRSVNSKIQKLREDVDGKINEVQGEITENEEKHQIKIDTRILVKDVLKKYWWAILLYIYPFYEIVLKPLGIVDFEKLLK